MKITISGAWLLATLEQVLLAFAFTFVSTVSLAGAGAFSLSSLHAAVIAGGVAAANALEAVLSAAIAPKAAPPAQLGIVTLGRAVGARLRHGGKPAVLPPPGQVAA